VAKSTAEENSERKRISIPKADESVLSWWEKQKDPGLSVRLLIRNEIERSGYTDAAYRPVTQLPRRGRPPGTGSDGSDNPESFEGADEQEAAPAAAPVLTAVPPVAAAPVAAPVAPAAQPVAAQPASSGFNPIDDIMNG
jgi:hypothetical protein